MEGLTFCQENKKSWRCTKGHTWKADYRLSAFRVQLPGEGHGADYCPYCLKEYAEANLGKVLEV